VFYWSSLLSNQSIQRCAGCVQSSHPPQSLSERSLVRNCAIILAYPFIFVFVLIFQCAMNDKFSSLECIPIQCFFRYDLGTLYESCNQISDSLDAYQRAAELDPSNKHIQQRLNMLRGQLNGDSWVLPAPKPTNPFFPLLFLFYFAYFFFNHAIQNIERGKDHKILQGMPV